MPLPNGKVEEAMVDCYRSALNSLYSHCPLPAACQVLYPNFHEAEIHHSPREFSSTAQYDGFPCLVLPSERIRVGF